MVISSSQNNTLLEYMYGLIKEVGGEAMIHSPGHGITGSIRYKSWIVAVWMPKKGEPGTRFIIYSDNYTSDADESVDFLNDAEIRENVTKRIEFINKKIADGCPGFKNK